MEQRVVEPKKSPEPNNWDLRRTFGGSKRACFIKIGVMLIQ
jgi:hypothetical protein